MYILRVFVVVSCLLYILDLYKNLKKHVMQCYNAFVMLY